MTRVGILETGRPSSEIVIIQHGDYPQMMRDYFKGQPDLAFTTYAVCNGHAMPAAADCDAWLITGSPSAVYEDHPWLPPLRDLIRATLQANIPTLGICFGHQVMAQAMGGTVAKSAKGRGIGIQRYALTPAGQWLLPGASGINLPASHQDQVIAPPPGATLLAQSAFCDYAAFAYGSAGLSFQPHPEFTAAGAQASNRSWQQQSPVAQSVINAAEASYAELTTDSQRLAPALAAFLTGRQAAQ